MAIKYIKQLEGLQGSNGSSFNSISSSCNRCKQQDSKASSLADNSLMHDSSMSDFLTESYQTGFRDCISESVRFLLQLDARSPADLMCVRLTHHLNQYLQRVQPPLPPTPNSVSSIFSSSLNSSLQQLPINLTNSPSNGSVCTTPSQDNSIPPINCSAFNESWALIRPQSALDKIQIKLEEMEVEENQSVSSSLTAARRLQQLQQESHHWSNVSGSGSVNTGSSTPSPTACPISPLSSMNAAAIAAAAACNSTATPVSLSLFPRPIAISLNPVQSPTSAFSSSNLQSTSERRSPLLLDSLANGSLGTTAPLRRLSAAGLAKSRSLTSSPNSSNGTPDTPAMYKFKKNIKERFQADLQSALLRPVSNASVCDHLPSECPPGCPTAGLRPRSATISTELCNGRPLPPSVAASRQRLLLNNSDLTTSNASLSASSVCSFVGSSNASLATNGSMNGSNTTPPGSCSPGFLLHPSGSFYVPIEVQLGCRNNGSSHNNGFENDIRNGSTHALFESMFDASTIGFRLSKAAALDSARILHPVSIAVHFGYCTIRLPPQTIACASL